MGNDGPYEALDVSACTPHQKLKILTFAADTRKFEIERFWHRSLFFWGFITAAVVAYGAAAKSPQLQAVAACYGFLCALAWSLQNRGSKYWHESWELKVERVQREVLGTNLFSNKEPIKRSGWLEAKRYSSSKLVMVLSDVTCVAWLGLIYFSLEIDPGAGVDWAKCLTVAVTFGAACALLFGTKSKP
jgi:hypothetical protein